jgi:hypothetical protein
MLLEKGYKQGPGASHTRGGAGHGSKGGDRLELGVTYPGGPAYGSSLEPIELGSEGGGGAIRLIVSDLFNNDGVVLADAFSGEPYRGSGGSIYITVNNLSGTGSFTANGKFFGAGGRIAIYYNTSSFTGMVVANGGDYSSGADGTVHIEQGDVFFGALSAIKSTDYQAGHTAKYTITSPLKGHVGYCPEYNSACMWSGIEYNFNLVYPQDGFNLDNVEKDDIKILSGAVLVDNVDSCTGESNEMYVYAVTGSENWEEEWTQSNSVVLSPCSENDYFYSTTITVEVGNIINPSIPEFIQFIVIQVRR